MEKKQVAGQKKRTHSLVVKRGDVYFADLGDKSTGNRGSEQSGIRPVLVLQNDVGNRFASTVVIASITSKIQKASLPTHVEAGVEDGLKKNSVILLEQIRTIDKERLSDFITHLDGDVMSNVDKATMISLGLI